MITAGAELAEQLITITIMMMMMMMVIMVMIMTTIPTMGYNDPYEY